MNLTKKDLQQIFNELKIPVTDDVLEKTFHILQMYKKLDSSEKYYFFKVLLFRLLVEIKKK